MKILLVHNYYGSAAPSGENKAFELERSMLKRNGCVVEEYLRHSDEIRLTSNGGLILDALHLLIGKIKGGLCYVGNPVAAMAVDRKCKEFKPDVVHFHNTFPLISPLAVWAASKYAPVVMTLHNYRTACAAGVPTRAGKVCSLCLEKRCVWDGIRHHCYRGSLLATLPLAINIALYRKWLPRWVTRFVVLSEFQKRKMVEYGWPEEKIAVKGNFVEIAELFNVRKEERKNQIVYVGRLSKEKGVETLIKAFQRLDINDLKLVVVGDGVDRRELENLAAGLHVEFVGKKSSIEARQIIAESKALVSPSVCWETFGLSAAEALSVGVPAVVSDAGALPDVVQNGRWGEVFKAGDVQSCAAAIKRLLCRPDYDEICGAACHDCATRYSEGTNYAQLMAIYQTAIRCR